MIELLVAACQRGATKARYDNVNVVEMTAHVLSM